MKLIPTKSEHRQKRSLAKMNNTTAISNFPTPEEEDSKARDLIVVNFSVSDDLPAWLRFGLLVYLLVSTAAGVLPLRIFVQEIWAQSRSRGRARAINYFVMVDLVFAVMGVVWNLHVIGVLCR